MARKRMIDPGFWTDEKLGTCTRDERLLFMGLISNADDEGRLQGHPALLKSMIFPYDCDITLEEVSSWAQSLHEKKLIQIYQVNGQTYIFIRNFLKHQTIKKPSGSKLPAPPSDFSASSEPVPNQFPTNEEPVPLKKKEEKRKEEKGRGREETARAREGKPDPPPAPSLVSLARVFEREFGRPLSPLELEQIGDWEDQYPGDIVLEALRRAVAQGVLKLKYIDRILLQWEKANLKTLREILDYEAQFEQRKLKVIHGGGAEPAPPPETVSEEDVGAAVTYISYNLQAYLEEHPNHTEDDLRQFLNSGKFDYPPGLKRRAFEKLKLTQYLERGP